MRLKKFSLQGFKTFAHLTNLEFSPDNRITAIVGPNGCGKSNLVDALRWVLGEQSLHSLRVGQIIELIFSGTRSKPPFSLAEVTLTFDNTDESLPVDFSEVSIKRRIYRSGESNFFINRQDCRLKDILHLFRGTGLGTNSYSIIGQGQIEEIILARPEERRLALEEVAGISQYHAQKSEASARLNSTEQNLLRLNDLVSELGQQLAPLEEQARQAQKYIELQKKVETLESDLILEEIKHLVIDREKNDQDLKAARQKILEIEKQCQEKEKALGLFQEANRSKIREYHLRRDILLEEEKKLLQAENQLQLCQEKEGLLVNQKIELGRSLEQAQAALAAYARPEQTGPDEPGSVRLASLKNRVQELTEALAARQRDYRQVMAEVENLQTSLAEAERRLARAESRRGEATRQQELLGRQAEKLGRDQSELNGLIRQLDPQMKEKQAERGLREKTLKDLQSKVAALIEERQRLSQEKETAGQKQAQIKTDLEEALKQLLLFLKTPAAPDSFDAKIQKFIIGRNIGALIREVGIEDRFAEACRSIFASCAENLKAAEKEHLFPQPGRRDGLKKEPGLAGQAGVIGWADEILRIKPSSQLWPALLADTLIVENREAAETLRQRFPVLQEARLATLSGEVLERRWPREKLAEKEKELGAGISRVETELSRMDSEVRKEEKLALTAELALTGLGREKAGLMEKERLIADSMLQVQEDLLNLPKQLKEAGAEISRAEQERDLIRSQIQKVQASYQKSHSAATEIQAELRQAQVEEATQRQRYREAEEEKHLARSALVNLKNQAEALAKQLELVRKNQAALAEEKKKFNEAIKAARDEREKAQRLLEQFERDFGGGEAHKESLEIALQNLRQELVRWQAAAAEKKINLSSLELMIQKVQQQLAEKYDLESLPAAEAAKMNEAAKAAPKLSAPELEVKKNQILRCQRQMKNLEPINFYALQEVAKIRQRLDFLSTQVDDLRKARENLQALIKQLDAEAVEKLGASIRQVNENFGRIFGRVFNGGTAYLQLCGSANILEAGLEIITQFPGKRRQNLLLLSGGERALTAIVFLMATLEVNPPPFCFFDEVDAALDEANIDRFIQLMREYSKHSQILIITHNKLTISSADAIYGVTMEEPGVSKIVSIKMEKKEVVVS